MKNNLLTKEELLNQLNLKDLPEITIDHKITQYDILKNLYILNFKNINQLHEITGIKLNNIRWYICKIKKELNNI